MVVEEDSENGELLLFSRNFQDTHLLISSRHIHLATLSLKYTVRWLIYYPIGREIDSNLSYV